MKNNAQGESSGDAQPRRDLDAELRAKTRALVRALRQHGHNGALAAAIESALADRALARDAISTSPRDTGGIGTLEALLDWSAVAMTEQLKTWTVGASRHTTQAPAPTLHGFATQVCDLIKMRLLNEGGGYLQRQRERTMQPASPELERLEWLESELKDFEHVRSILRNLHRDG